MSDSFSCGQYTRATTRWRTEPGRRCADGDLSEAVRQGSTAAYHELYARHVGAAYSAASQLSRSRVDADDLVSEAFVNVLAALRGGHGPVVAFRAYLLTSVRHLAFERARREQRLQLTGDIAEVLGDGEGLEDLAIASLERSLAARAFANLPQRWRTVLWHVEVEGLTPGQVAPFLGLTPNGVAALAYRARKGLRQAYREVSRC
ncbi:sigma-70 family RNA polymerase sigma factor [Saccharopolyspora sp. K220]|uniref:RNA polymerase sigma factor n=1 Tax=Saccharopolyspora soli TaxID=2926618 RepID=UPI001F58FAEA|nr:sigma-70 family RNA polymerase sigma factor [Saccharopolyspora soli]MCI2423341.1 sigma-70 family RNA polymerase sigma factor [Saccharopolyspora soli]